MSLSPKVLVMIPAYNEEKTVGDVVKSVMNLYPDFKVVVIDDGSDDGTAKNAAEAGAEVVSLPFHCGGNVVIQTGYLIAQYNDCDYALKIDADGQHIPEEISRLLTPLFNDEADMTVGSRYLTTNNDYDSSIKDSGRVFSSTLVSLLRKVNVTDITSGMRAWNRKAMQVLLPIYMERRTIEDSVFWLVETMLASKMGLRLKEVAIKVLPRSHGKSKSFSRGKMLLYPIRLITVLVEEVTS